MTGLRFPLFREVSSALLLQHCVDKVMRNTLPLPHPNEPLPHLYETEDGLYEIKETKIKRT